MIERLGKNLLREVIQTVIQKTKLIENQWVIVCFVGPQGLELSTP